MFMDNTIFFNTACLSLKYKTAKAHTYNEESNGYGF